jgi:hypothetical protein
MYADLTRVYASVEGTLFAVLTKGYLKDRSRWRIKEN